MLGQQKQPTLLYVRSAETGHPYHNRWLFFLLNVLLGSDMRPGTDKWPPQTLDQTRLPSLMARGRHLAYSLADIQYTCHTFSLFTSMRRLKMTQNCRYWIKNIPSRAPKKMCVLFFLSGTNKTLCFCNWEIACLGCPWKLSRTSFLGQPRYFCLGLLSIGHQRKWLNWEPKKIFLNP